MHQFFFLITKFRYKGKKCFSYMQISRQKIVKKNLILDSIYKIKLKIACYFEQLFSIFAILCYENCRKSSGTN
jgi:hypothetical protein